MTNSIEQAAARLEQLRKAGAFMDDSAPATPAPAAPPAPAPAPAAATTELPVLVEEPLKEPVKAELFGEDSAFPGVGTVSRVVNIDTARLAALGCITPDAPRSHISDQYRVIKRPLLDNARGKGAAFLESGNCIMVTSSLPGEGKSFTALNLAISMAMEMDHTVMLVDADVAKPSLMKMLGLPPSPGLLDLLVDETLEMSKVLLRTNLGRLTILPSGSPRDSATELLASSSMTHLVEDMGKRYKDRIIIFDSPPLLLTTESRVLATHMGQIVMVVQAEKTLQSQVKHALATIESCPIKLMLLNQARTGGTDAYGYGYGYGYGHGYGYGEKEAKSAEAGGGS